MKITGLFAILLLTGCSLFEDISDVTFQSPDLDETIDMSTDVPADTSLDVPPDQDVDVDVDIGENCATSGCLSLGLGCNASTGMCEACVEGESASVCHTSTVCEAGACVCPSNTNLCGTECVPQSATSCTAACTPCPNVPDGTSNCTDNTCGFSCDGAGTVAYKNQCVPGGGVCASNAATLDGTCDLVFQTGCNAETEICATLLRITNICVSQAECVAGQSCSEVSGVKRCVYFESGCSNVVETVPVCSNSNDCLTGQTCTGGKCGPCTANTDCPTNQRCLENVCRGGNLATLQLGESCAGTLNRCAGGLQCSVGFCKSVCDTSTGAGCAANHVCRPLQPGAGAGLCESSCT